MPHISARCVTDMVRQTVDIGRCIDCLPVTGVGDVSTVPPTQHLSPCATCVLRGVWQYHVTFLLHVTFVLDVSFVLCLM